MDNEVSERGLAREMYQSSQEVVHVNPALQSHTPQHLPKKKNRFAWVLFAVVLFGVSVGISGGYYLLTHEITLPQFFLGNAPTPEPQKILTNAEIVQQELQGFPPYPGATYIKKETVPPCIGAQSGYAVCDAITYTWETNDPVDKVQLSYRGIIEKASVWTVGGGAGSIGDGGVETYKKGDFGVDVHVGKKIPGVAPSSSPTTIIVAIPRVAERTRKEDWKTYKTELGISMKVPQEILVYETAEAVDFYLDEKTKRGSGISIFMRNIESNNGIDVTGRELSDTVINGYEAKYLADNPITMKDYWIYSSDKKRVVRVTISTVGETGQKQQENMQLYSDMLLTIDFEE